MNLKTIIGDGRYYYSFGPDADYGLLKNKPIINGKVLERSISLEDLGLRPIYYDTTENWNSKIDLIGEAGAIYIYSDHVIETDPETGRIYNRPGIKIGTGNSYLIDNPFVEDSATESFTEHINDKMIHITEEERQFWNNKVTSYISSENPEMIIFTKE